MGWTVTHKPKGVTTLDFLRSRIDCGNEAGTWKVIAGVARRGVTYLAIDYLDKRSGRRRVFGAAFPVRHYPRARDGYNFGYQDVTEDMGPADRHCPDKILDLLSPTDDIDALRWRVDCRANNARRRARRNVLKQIPSGATLKFKEPMSFKRYGTTECLRLVDMGKRLFALPQVGRLVRLRPNTLLDGEFEVVEPSSSGRVAAAVA
jgi:hypothetical protein